MSLKHGWGSQEKRGGTSRLPSGGGRRGERSRCEDERNQRVEDGRGGPKVRGQRIEDNGGRPEGRGHKGKGR